MWKKFVSDYLTFSKKDRIGIFVLTGFLAAALLSPLAFPYLKKEQPVDEEQSKKILSQLSTVFSDSAIQQKNNEAFFENDGDGARELFYFDPNTATIDDWQKLGVHKNVAATIQKYLSKGGKFNSPEDLRKIYTLSAKDAERLIPYIRIRLKQNTPSQFMQTSHPETPVFTNKPPARKAGVVIDINEADTSALIALPGIGSKLAQRIVNFREKLGGFTSVGQVAETRFLPDSTFQKIKPFLQFSNASIKKININNATFDALNAHPYISYQVANAIVQFRNQNGKFETLDGLKKIHIVDDTLFRKIKPYLTLE